MPSSAGDADARAAEAKAAKGKDRMDAAAEAKAAEGVPCGICLTDSRRAIRGELDCCAHHFCFVCIMAWARVESRCPYCKARFRTIRRPPVPGRLPDERIVAVAERIQVWHPLGNESSLVGADPSTNSRCSVCSCTNDEDLLLLCELCDVAAHTYCAGLGTTVPEEDWFCRDCATSKEEHSRCQNDDGGGPSDDQGELEITVEVPSCAQPAADRSRSGVADEDHSLSSERGRSAQRSGGPVSIYGNTGGYYGANPARPANARSSGPFQIPSIYDEEDEDYEADPAHVENGQSSGPVPSIYDIVDDDDETLPRRRASVRSARPDRTAGDVASQGSSSDESICLGSSQERTGRRALLRAPARFGIERARTLRNSRNLTNRITELRENWSAIRAGSVGFAAQLHKNRRESSAAASSVNEHERSKTALKETLHVSRAWKMLDMAKSSGGRKKCNNPSSLDCTPRFSMGNRSTSISPIDTILGQKNQSLSAVVAQRNTVKYDRGAKNDHTLPKKDTEGQHSVRENCHALALERSGSFQGRMVIRESLNGNVASASASHRHHVVQRPKSPCGSKVASSSHSQHVDRTSEPLCGSSRSGRHQVNALHPFSKSLSSGLSTVTSSLQLELSAGSQSGMMLNPEEPSAIQVTSSSEIGAAAATVEVSKNSGSDRHGSKRKLRSETSDDQISKKQRKSCKIAKGEISSLALRELKLLKIDKIHGSEKFKEVARAATHTVLAACGLEHTPSVAVALLPKPVCKHSRRTEPPKASVIANTCKECLSDIVKQAISSVLPGKEMDQAAASY